MKLLQVALAGVLGFAGLTAGASYDKANAPHANSEQYTYHCEALDILQCNLDGSCTIFQNCAHRCINLNAFGGAVYDDEPPKYIKARGAAWDDDKASIYFCEGLDIQRCNHRLTVCESIEHCADGCYDTGHGALCVDKAIKSRDGPDSASVTAAQSKCDGVSGKCRVCTPTHRGVYTCEYDFCAVKPGDWCRSGWSCHDDCDCCKKDRKRGAKTLERSIDNLEVSPVRKCEPVEPAQVLDSPYGSCPKEFWGYQSCRDNNSVIVVCDPADSNWRAVGKCVGGDHCCESRRDNPYAAQCKC